MRFGFKPKTSAMPCRRARYTGWQGTGPQTHQCIKAGSAHDVCV